MVHVQSGAPLAPTSELPGGPSVGGPLAGSLVICLGGE